MKELIIQIERHVGRIMIVLLILSGILFFFELSKLVTFLILPVGACIAYLPLRREAKAKALKTKGNELSLIAEQSIAPDIPLVGMRGNTLGIYHISPDEILDQL